MKTTTKLWIGIGVLALLSPLGLAIPALFGAHGSWGEWGADELGRMTGFVPRGMKRIAGLWKAPMPGYAVPGQDQGLGYLLAGLAGLAATAGLVYGIAKLLVRKHEGKKR